MRPIFSPWLVLVYLFPFLKNKKLRLKWFQDWITCHCENWEFSQLEEEWEFVTWPRTFIERVKENIDPIAAARLLKDRTKLFVLLLLLWIIFLCFITICLSIFHYVWEYDPLHTIQTITLWLFVLGSQCFICLQFLLKNNVSMSEPCMSAFKRRKKLTKICVCFKKII